MPERDVEPQIESVLPPVPPSDLTDIGDLLTDDEKQRLRDDLAELTRLRRRAAAESAGLVIGG